MILWFQQFPILFQKRTKRIEKKIKIWIWKWKINVQTFFSPKNCTKFLFLVIIQFNFILLFFKTKHFNITNNYKTQQTGRQGLILILSTKRYWKLISFYLYIERIKYKPHKYANSIIHIPFFPFVYNLCQALKLNCLN